jgi:NADH-quinone oxidoreductase subunit G
MCDYGRLNYKWIGRDDRLSEVKIKSNAAPIAASSWPTAIRSISERLANVQPGTLAIVASARQTNEELYLLKKIATKTEAITDSVPRKAAGDKLLLNEDRNPNSIGSRVMGISPAQMGSNLPKIAEGIRSGKIKTLIVFGEDVTKYGIAQDLLQKLECLIISDILPNHTTALAHYILPGCAHAEKRGTFTNAKGRVQKFVKAVEAPGAARPEWEFLHELVFNVTGQNGYASIEGLFNQMTKEVAPFAGLTWASLGDMGQNIPI